ncbi:MAG: hypothetical protein ABRQ37_14255 [Candidatus Eremiobacterota bacterium]
MRNLFILSVLLCLIFRTEAAEITVEESRMLGLIRFLYCISDTDKASNTMKQIYIDKRGNNENDKIYIKKFKDIFTELPQHISLYSGKKIDIEKMPVKYKTTNLLYYYGAASKDFKDFKFLLSSVIPEKQLGELIEVIEYFLPVYNELYYEKSEKNLKELLEKRNKEKDFYNNILDNTLRFYSSSVPACEIKIILVPLYIPAEERENYRKKHMSVEGQSLGNLQIVETLIPSGEKSENDWYVCVHETVHYYQNLSSLNETLKEEMKRYDEIFGKTGSLYLDEAIATIIQTYSASLSGHEPDYDKEWYNDKIIDGYAKEFYGDVTDYIKNNKVLDKNLVIKGVEIFKKKFPDAPFMKEIVCNEMNIMSDTFNMMEIMPLFGILGRSRSVYGNDRLNGKDILKNYDRQCTQVFVLKENELARLTPYSFIDKEKIREELQKSKNFTFSMFDKKRGIFNIVFMCEDCDKLKELLGRLKEKDILTDGIVSLPGERK